MSTAYKLAKKYYDEGLWGKDRLKALVEKGKLTEDEYEDITGEKYE